MSRKQSILFALGILGGAFITYLLFRDTDWIAVGQALAEARLPWICLAFLATFGGFFFQAWRWREVVASAGDAPFRKLFTSTLIANLLHAMLPTRGGPLVRAFFLSRTAKLPFSSCLSASVIDRIPELIVFALLVGIAALTVPLDGHIVINDDVFNTQEAILLPDDILLQSLRLLAIVFLVMVSVLSALVLGGDRLVALAQRGRFWRLGAGLELFNAVIHEYRGLGPVVRHLGWTIVTFGCHMLGALALLQAFGIPSPWWGPVFLLVMTVLAVVLPGVPGFVGQYHVAIVLSLVVIAPHLSGSEMKAVAVAGHGIYMLLLGMLGVASLFIEHVNIFQIRESELAGLETEEQQS